MPESKVRYEVLQPSQDLHFLLVDKIFCAHTVGVFVGEQNDYAGVALSLVQMSLVGGIFQTGGDVRKSREGSEFCLL